MTWDYPKQLGQSARNQQRGERYRRAQQRAVSISAGNEAAFSLDAVLYVFGPMMQAPVPRVRASTR